MPEPRHSVDMESALGLLPAIWLSQSVLALLVQCQQRRERETLRERKKERELSKGAFQVSELTCSILPSCFTSQVSGGER